MPRHQRDSFAVSVSALAAATLIAGCGAPPGMGPPPQAGTPEVGVEAVHAQPVSLTTELPGRTSPYLIADVRPQVNGIIKSRRFKEGSDVKAGDTLYQIDPATYQTSVASAQAALEKSQAALYSAQLKAQRYQDLVKIQAVSQQDADDASASLKQAEADIAANRASLSADRINLDYTRVTSPISGRIGRSSVTPGALVTANQSTALATVQQLDPIYVDVTQSSVAVLRLRRELAAGKLTSDGANRARVKLMLEDGSAYPLTGALQFSDVTVDQNTGTITLRAVFPNPKQELLPGMFVRAVLEEGVDSQALLVPQRAVTRDAKGNATAYVVSSDGKAELRQLTAVRTVGDRWLVSSGVKPGDQVIVDGLQRVKPGQPVKATAVASSASAAAVTAEAGQQAGSGSVQR